ncbi:MAG: hypothetical protein EBV72_14290, partial [Betaproteobacteria bacterium]|nr:hypothetical protein [Betaproteobacteria bacterium]
AQAILAAGARTCHILYPPEDAMEGWDAADAISEGFDVGSFLEHGPRLQMHDVALEDEPVAGIDESVWGTEDALALAFTRRYHKDWRYVATWGRWLVWDGSRWRTEDTLAATDLIRSVCRHAALKSGNPKVAAKLASASTVSGVERLARADRRHAANTEEWDADPWLINTIAGVTDLRTGRERAHDRSDRMTKIATATPRGECPTWLQFLREITGGDQALQDYLQWAVQGCLAWQRLGKLDPPQQVLDATEAYFEGEDALGRWLEERCVLAANARSLTAELFNDWKLWADAAGEFVGSQKRFSDLLISRGIEKWRNAIGLRGFRGLGLKAQTTASYAAFADQ